MSKLWEQNIDEFIALAAKHNVRMLMVGGGAEFSWISETFF